ncbi:MAG TPA: hypothetical protein VEV64_02950 [Rhizomicrobium sp.]|nr:hypothetical protein [Rhizomicrobium sp.]
MSPIGMAFIFGLLAVAAAYGLWRSFATGVTSDELHTFREDENPAGFMAVTAGKMFVLVFGVAEVLHAFGLCGDPMAPLRAIFG